MNKKKKKRFAWVLGLGLLLGNIVVYNHAYRFTHFAEVGTRTISPEDLSFSDKLSTLFWGVSIPKPINNTRPQEPFETIYLESHKKIEAWLIEVENHKGVVLLFHGYSSHKSSLLNYAKAFREMGFTTLLVDFMGSGGSEGYQTTVGVKESRDVKEAFEYAKQRFPQDELILYGPSMGAVAIMKSIVDYDLQADKLLLECPFGTMLKTTKKRFEAMGLPTFPFAELLLIYGGLQNGFNPFQHNPEEYAKKIKTPVLLLQGAKDQRVTRQEIDAIFENIRAPKTLHILEESGHENYLYHSKVQWQEVVRPFLEKKF